jgi:hypothetical protein
MNKNEIIYKFIDEHAFPADYKWEMLDPKFFTNSMYISHHHWCKIRDMFSISEEEVIQHLNEYLQTKIDIPLGYNVLLEPEFMVSVNSSGGTFIYS